MIAFPAMLVLAAEKAGIDTPKNPEEYDPQEYPLWHLFCNAQLGQPMPYAGCHWDNAHIIAQIPLDKLKTITFEELKELGFQIGYK